MQITQRIQFSGISDVVLDVLATDYKLFLLGVGATTVAYIWLSGNGQQWERGLGSLGIGGAFTRDTVLENHLGTTAKVDFDQGLHLLQIDPAQLVIENRTSDPGAPVDGQIWLRTDL